ncbi:efflux transporter outer membrane subunit [Fulvimonas sp. R45]|uniref:efflux transporter outer membrane subunit n=1 Tax=Fulvimonas sp. R45 TaxID=3045937 RepID=UPI00265E8028|nr:efflux transporter outer membrane subunit [Fulvimonas sp. R45]MDO1529654.1 efflux transporter outer membrane subunit [Fulvimonas sp. R45]
MTRLLRSTALFAALALAGCASVGPDYKAPAAPTPQLQGLDAARESAAQFQAAWWKQFGDPTLDALIQRAAAGNLDLRIAQARLAESRALLGGAKSQQWPTLDAGASYTRSREQTPGVSDQRNTVTAYQAGFDASWEIDLFGGVRRSVEAARADLGAGEAALQGAQVSLFAEVARNYFELRGTQQRQAIAERDIANLRDTLKLIQARAEVGTASEQDVASARARLSAVEAQLPLLDMQAHAGEYRLAVLLGEQPGALDVDVSPKTFKPIDAVLPIGAAGDVLSRRPDVRIAEREYAAATARIGVAKADFFPHISLGGFLGFLAGRSNDFGSPATRAWSIAPSITWQGLNVQRVRSELHAAEARADAAQAGYRRTVLEAIEDVDNAVVGYNQQHARVEKLVEQAQQSRRAAKLAKVRYEQGATGFLELLDAERVQLAAEDDLAQAQSAIDTRAVALYKALGGGWQACGDARCTQVAQPAVADAP